MMAACAPASPVEGFVRNMLDFVDCQAQSLGAEGYRALAAPGSTLSLVLLVFLTLFVALFGYRMLFGQVPGVRDGVLALVKIGIVLALATGWTAYRTLIYDVAFHGPAELAAEIGGPAAVPGAGGGLVARLDGSDRAMVALAALGVGEPPATATTPPAEPGQPALPTAAAREAQGYDGLALTGGRILYLAGAVGALAATRLVAGLMLALGPFFVAFLLFEGTRGLFEGWLRVLGGAALGALGAALVLGIELAMLEPWLAELIARRTAAQSIAGAPVQLFAFALVFDLVLLAMLIAAARLAYGFRMPAAWRETPALAVATLRGEPRRAGDVLHGREAANADRSRATMIADAVAASQRRESAPAAAAAMAMAGASAPAARHLPVRDLAAPPPPPRLGQSFRRRTRTRVSASGGRRDRAL